MTEMKIKVNAEFWTQLEQQAKVWRVGVLPGLVVVGLVVIARLTGSLQSLEWSAFDRFLRSRPVESPDTRIVIVGINEEDIRLTKKYPIPDRELAALLKTLQSYRPTAIGLDLFRDLTTDPNREALAQVFRTSPNLIGIEADVGSTATLKVKPPPELPPEQVGLANIFFDSDGKLRRCMLASKVDSGEVKYSLSLLLAARYLQTQGIPFEPGRRASDPIRFGSLVLPRFRANTGGYVQAQAGGNQILLNFRSHPKPFPVVSMTDVMQGRVKPEQIRDRIVLIGVTASNSLNDTVMTDAIKGSLLTDATGTMDEYRLLYGVENHAHAISQIISAVLDHRPLLQTWAKGWEYSWIIFWGLLGITLGLLLQSPWKTLLGLAVGSTCLISISYGLITLSWWIPVIPALLALGAAGLTTALFDRDSRLLLEQRSLTLKRTYDAVHNGPLQTLAAMLRSLDDLPPEKLRSQLQNLNQELRSVYDSMHQAIVTGNQRYAQTPIQELLYQIYEKTLERELPGFTSILTFIAPDFTVLKDCPLSPDQKQALCLFLQEALCNVGNHAINASCLDVICRRNKNWYTLQVIDNGACYLAQVNAREGQGTAQARELARSLRGSFQRRPNVPHGLVCELTWRSPRLWWQFSHPFQSTQHLLNRL
ncbi:MAG: CHASE2 domain-containing protein [Stenomitos rutilans HA7619-LM2]|nr:CHASE2 domain-containing protein [Stenomitos rutilans HA7619-LM2]